MDKGLRPVPYIETTLNRQQAEALFEQEALVFNGSNCGVPEYRIAALLGDDVVDYAWNHPREFTPGKETNYAGNAADDCIMFFCRSGFMRLVSVHNYRLTLAAHQASAAGQRIDDRNFRRRAELVAAEAEERRRAKRAAAKARRQEAVEA